MLTLTSRLRASTLRQYGNLLKSASRTIESHSASSRRKPAKPVTLSQSRNQSFRYFRHPCCSSSCYGSGWSEAGTRNKGWNSKLKCQVAFCTKAKERRRQGNGHLYMPNRHKTACLSILEYTGGSLLLSMESVEPLCSS